jgi:uncharacterized membrane protein
MGASRPLSLLRDLFPGRRLILATLVGVLFYAALPGTWGEASRGALAWVLAVGLFLALTALAVGDAPPERLRARARAQDESRWVILVLIVTAAAVSLAAVVVLLHKQDGETLSQLLLRVGLAAGVVVSSWSLTHTIFAVHYVHGYYGDGPAPGAADDAGGLLFPGANPLPDFWDFLYFALVIGMTCQVSDVQITGRHMRRLATLHGVLSFFFNTVILALTVNFIVNAT